MTRTLRRLWSRLRGSFFGRRREGDLAEEIESHIRFLAEEEIRRGLPPAQAYRRARLQFGSVESTKESYRDQRGLPAFDAIAQDLRYAVRGLRRNPGFAAVAIVSLAIGIGANTAIFSLVHSVLLQPLAFKDPQRLYSVRELNPMFAALGPLGVNPVHGREWGARCASIEQVALVRGGPAQVVGGSEPVSVPGVRVSHDFFALLGVAPMLGRAFLPEEEQEGNDRVAILSESLWRSRFQADPTLVGKTIVIDGEKHQVAGVVSASFRPPYARFAEVFRPLALSPAEASRRMGNYNYAAIVRLRAGVTAGQALAEINVVQARFRADLKATLIPAHEVVTGRAQAGLWMLAAAVGAVLLIVCVNLANLLLSRMTSRSRESAIRTALGASRARQFCQVLTESLLLAVCGGALGMVFAAWTIQLLAGASTLDIPRLAEVRLDFGVLAFAFGLTLFTGLLFGALPAWHFTRHAPQEALRSGSHTVTTGRRGLRVREGLIGLEVGLSAALLIVAGLLATSLMRLLNVDKGFEASRVITVNIGLAGPLYADPSNCERFFERVLAKLGAMPGVQAAGITTTLPTQGDTWNDPIYLEGQPREEWRPVNNRYASPGLFRAMNMVILRGRAFEESDRGQSVAVLSEKAAKLLWPGDANPVGRRFIGEDDKPKVLVGIMAEVRAVLERDPPPTAYYPYWQRPPDVASLVVRTTSGVEAVAPVLRAVLRSEDAALPIQAIRTMEELVDRSVVERRFQLTMMLAFAGAALLVASLGIYGVVAYSVARRRNEIGIRMALGGGRSQLLWLILRQGMAPVVFGLAVGVAAALVLGQAIRGLLFGVQPSDPLTIGGVAVVLLTVGVVACLVPARRAIARDALEALRFE